MPRTKRPVRTQEKTGVKDDVLKKLDKIVAEQKANIDSRVQMECRNVELAFKIMLGSISKTDLSKTVGQLKHELHLKEAANSRKTRNSSHAPSHDEGYLTETSQGSAERGKRTMGPPTAMTSITRASRSRSADASARKHAPATAAKLTRRRSRSAVYKTPAYNKMGHNYPAITPKMAPHTPLSLLRLARQGEMVMSMSGSPIMVPSVGGHVNSDSKAHCNFTLQDGTVLSLQPKQLRESQAFIPLSLMDENVLSQLRTLQDNLAKVVKMGESIKS